MEKYRVLAYIASAVTAGMIYWVSSLQLAMSPGEDAFFSKALAYHFSIFFLFGLLLFIGAGHRRRMFVGSFIFATFYAALDEIHQLYVPGRSGSFFDFGVDMIGIVMSLAVVVSMEHMQTRRAKV